MQKNWMVIGGVVLVVLIVLGSLVGKYNQIVSADKAIPGAWAQVENVLQRRYDLIPNLVNTVKGYAKHEKDIFEQYAIARQLSQGAKTVEEKVRASNAMESFVSRLLVVVEQYPNLKANENFLRLQDELAGTENRIAVERMRYNDTVLLYNTLVSRFPSSIIAKMFKFESKDDLYFKTTEAAKEAPKVNFE